MPRRPAYEVVTDQEARAELAAIPVFHRRQIVQAIRELEHRAETVTRNRKPLDEPLDLSPDATWEVRAASFRVFYRVDERTVRVLRVYHEDRNDGGEPVSRWTVSRAEARELARRDERTRREGGASLADIEADMRRDLVKELRRMVRSYSGKPRETRALLEGIAIAGTEGVTAEDLADVLGKLREKLAKNAA